MVGLDCSEALAASGKTGAGVREILEQIVRKVPPPHGTVDAKLSALVFDSWYDTYRGAVAMVRVVDGVLKKGDKLRFLMTGTDYEVIELGRLRPFAAAVEELHPGEVGFIAANIKSCSRRAARRHGDALGQRARQGSASHGPDVRPATGVQGREANGLRRRLSNRQRGLPAAPRRDGRSCISTTRPSSFEPDTSEALGFGFRCGFLGLLHMEIIQERLEREFNLDLITTAPSVVYYVYLTSGEKVRVENPAKLPSPQQIERCEEPIVTLAVHVPAEFVGPVLALCQERRGVQKGMQYASADRVIVTYEVPFAEVLFDFHDRLKSITRGYASMDYEVIGYRPDVLVKVDILVNGEPPDALSIIVHKEKAYARGRSLAEKLKEFVPRQQYDVAIQAAIGGKIIARESVKRPPEGRHREVLRRRHLAKAKAPREAEGGEEAHEAGRERGDPPAGVPGDPQGRPVS